MKTVPLQLLTVNLEDGRQGVFIGVPLVSSKDVGGACQIDEIWFSDTQELPGDITVARLIELVMALQCACRTGLQ